MYLMTTFRLASTPAYPKAFTIDVYVSEFLVYFPTRAIKTSFDNESVL